MKIKSLFFIALIFVSSLGAVVAQEMCFKNDGLKMQYSISFLLVGNKVTEGEFSTWNYDASTSGETMHFSGTKSGNTLTIKFDHTIPDGMPPKTKQFTWTLKNNKLIVPTYGKNYNTNKYSTYQAEYDICESVKADDYEENSKSAIIEKACACEAFVIDPDKGGLNVRETPDKNAGIAAKIPYNSEGTIVSLIGSAENGWVKANEARDIYDKKIMSKTGWIAGNKIGIGTKGYDGKSLNIYKAPKKDSGTIGTVPPETTVSIIGCDGAWLKVKYKNVTGWLSPDDQCANPASNCN